MFESWSSSIALVVHKEHILAEIQRTARENGGKPLGSKRFATETGIRTTDWAGRYWARWGDALQEAGFEPNPLQPRFDDEEVLAQLVPEIRRFGRMPTTLEMRLRKREDPTFPNDKVFARFGSNRELLKRVADYCSERPECADVLLIATSLLEDADEPSADERGAEVEDFGFVYLLRSGRNYKIGRTNAIGRRERELAIQLPEPANTIHVIKTDDPPGIERYWHARFADRRKGGEWFELTPDEVRAFKRRKFM